MDAKKTGEGMDFSDRKRKAAALEEKVEDDSIIQHPGRNFGPVAQEILVAHPEDSFCFLNIGKLRERIGVLRDHFLPDNPHRAIAYAVKANPKRRILEILTDEGVNHFDCVSQKEIDSVKRVNPGAEVLFNHPIKTAKDIRYASSRYGVGHYTAQSHREIEKILDNASPALHDRQVEIAVRLKTPNERARINLSPKFGATDAEVGKMIREIRRHFNCVPGISVHTGSQNGDPETFTDAIRKMADIARREGGVKTMNVGGGIPVNYFPGDHFDIKEYLQTITRAVESDTSGAFLDDPKIIIELGRAIIAEAVDLVIPVLAVENREKPCVYFKDGVFSSFTDYAVHGWIFNFQPLRTLGDGFSARIVPDELYGQTCDSGDTLGEVYLPDDIREGDYIWVANAGAYLDCLHSKFSGHEAAQYVTYNPSP
jgi:ornithine decarboxylase